MYSPPTVALLLDLYDGTGAPITQGAALLTPNIHRTDIDDGVFITTAQVRCEFGDGLPVVNLIPNDAPGFVPPGSAWHIAFQSVPGNPDGWTMQVPAGPAAFTVMPGSPAVFSWTPTTMLEATGLPNGTGITLYGCLPAEFTAGVTYWVVGAAGRRFQLAVTPGGPPLAASGAGPWPGTLAVAHWRLSALAPVSDPVALSACLPAPSGIAAVGEIPVMTGIGAASKYNGNILLAPAPTGADQASIQQMIDAAHAAGGGRVVLGAGTYSVTGLTTYPFIYLEGAGIGATVITLAAGSNADVIQGANFSALTMTGAAAWGSSGVYDCGISNLTIDGNAAGQTGTSYGVRLYGYQWTLRDLAVRNCRTSGIWSEWGSLLSDAPVTSEGSESTAVNVRVSYNGTHGWQHLGPSDVRFTNVLCFHNNANAGASGIGLWALSDRISNVMSTASAMNGTRASGFSGTFSVGAASLGGATDLYPSSGTLTVTTSSGTAQLTYSGKTATTLTGCQVTSGSGNFVTGNPVVWNRSAAARFTTNGLQLAGCHSWSNNHSWAAVFDSQVSDTDCHWEGAEYGQLLVRVSANKSGGFIYDLSTMSPGLGIQLGDDGLTPGVPLSASLTANACDIRTRVAAFLNDVQRRCSLNWVSAAQSSADVLAVTKTTGTYSTVLDSGSNGADLSTFTSGSPGTLFVTTTQQIPNGPGTVTVVTATGTRTATFTGTSADNFTRTPGTSFTGVVAAPGTPSGSTMSTGATVTLQNMGTLAIGGTVDRNSRVRIQAQSAASAASTGASFVQELGPHTFDIGAATNGFRLRSNGSDRLNVNASNGQVQWPNGTDHRWYSDNYSTITAEINGPTGIVTGKAVAASGLTGAAARLVGAHSGAPSSGTWNAGDIVADPVNSKIWLCTTGGTPGKWAALTLS